MVSYIYYIIVSSQPDFCTSTIEDGDILIMASDGLWDVKSNEDIRKQILLSDKSAQEIADDILNSVKLHFGKEITNSDNTTIVVTKFTKSNQVSLNLSEILPDTITPTASWKTDSTSSGNLTPRFSTSTDSMPQSNSPMFAREDTPILEYSDD